MYLRRLSVADFRSWPAADLSFEPGVSVLVGPNGAGKTNLVEAVGYLGTFGSHRVATDAPLVRRGTQLAVVRGLAVRGDRELAIEVQITPGKANKVRVNRSPLPRAREALGIVRSVLFAPEDLALVRGDPGERRRFLDELLILRWPRYAGVRSDYDRVVRQRSALLKTAKLGRSGSAEKAELSTLDVWDGHLARHGAALLAGRLRLVAELAGPVRDAYAEVAGPAAASAPADARYRSGVVPGEEVPDEAELEQALLDELGRTRRQELERGVCLVGPHRDDLELRLGDGPAKGYASHGESWSLALALRLGSFELLRADLGEPGDSSDPILILDDVFAELDGRRRDALAELAVRAEQVLVTAAVPDDVPEKLSGARFDVGSGQVTGPISHDS
ncbi:DNA replication/repair protein RecF [Pseudonocardia acaciae]|uniref:DNA replication/repair protein RecF n=1 Tax=Pseudonocardia acaciae TaxID=551276 RepID=UPI00048B4231|nr:DNA replication/repair protein RecF [Pseudonocardia acaciae]